MHIGWADFNVTCTLTFNAKIFLKIRRYQHNNAMYGCAKQAMYVE